jgi:hypothetical protein
MRLVSAGEALQITLDLISSPFLEYAPSAAPGPCCLACSVLILRRWLRNVSACAAWPYPAQQLHQQCMTQSGVAPPHLAGLQTAGSCQASCRGCCLDNGA